MAYLRRELDRAGLDQGVWSEEDHAAYLAASPKARAEAERRAGMVRLVRSLPQDTIWADKLKLLREAFGSEGTDKRTLQRYVKAVEGVDPINWAPALLPHRKGRVATVNISDQAWRFFLTSIHDAAPDWPLKQAWRNVRDVAKVQGWDWPSFATVYRRWAALPVSQQWAARYGAEETEKRLTQPALRDKTTLRALDLASLDGRTQDYWAHDGDGKAYRPTMLVLVDVASNMVLGWTLTRSENAVATVSLIRDTCQRHGIFDRLYTDNGSAFAGHLVAGGNVHRFRNAGKKREGVQPLGVCHHLGIRLHFALPANAQAKIAERTFAALSRVVDDGPEFAGAHAGHAPGASPSSDVRPIHIDDARRIVAREIDRHNSERERRSQGARGRSYAGVFAAGLAERIVRKPTARQSYLAGLIYTPVAVDRNGRMKVDHWTYGDPLTMDDLLPYHGTGKRVLLGRDPSDLSQPAIAFDEDGHLICQGIAAVERGAYDSRDGIRTAARNRKAARKATAEADAANDYLDQAEFDAAMARLDLSVPPAPSDPAPSKVVGARFGGPLREPARESKQEAAEAERYRRLWNAKRDSDPLMRRLMGEEGA